MPQIVRQEYFGAILEPILGEIFYGEYDLIPTMIPEIFSMRTTDKPYEDDHSIGAMGVARKFTGTVQYDRMYYGYKKVYDFPEFAEGFGIERKWHDDQMRDVIKGKPEELALAFVRRREIDAAMVFNYANATTGTDVEGNTVTTTGGDSKALCATDHPSMAYVAGASGAPEERSNYDTLELNHTNLQTIKNRMRATEDDRGNLVAVVPDTLIVGVSNEEVAWELISSTGKVNTADNNPNIHQGRYKVIVWDYLEDDGRWFMVDSRYSKRFLKWYDRIPVEFAMAEEFDELIAKYRAYARWSSGWSDWVWVYGNFPA